MAEYEYVVRKESPIEETVDIRKLIGKKILSKGGTVVGTVSQLRVNTSTLELEGIMLTHSFGKHIYIGKSYFSTISQSAIILNVELSLLIEGKKVVAEDGTVIGKVLKVNRRENTNDLESLVVKSLWRSYLIPASEIKQVKTSVLIKSTYDAAKIYIRKRSE